MSRRAWLLLPVLTACGTTEATTPRVRPTHWAQPVLGVELGNCYRVSPSVYRCAQPDASHMQELVALGVRSVVNLREYHDDVDEIDELPLQRHDVPVAAGSLTYEQLVQAVRAMLQAEKPVAVHCWRGADRTGAVVAAWRVAIDGWTPAEALAEMTDGGFGHSELFDNLRTMVANLDRTALRQALALPPAPPRAPNIVVLFVDDLGWKDLGVYGQAIAKTPRIDRLAAEGLVCTQAYAAGPVCSPTRAALMTGKYPARVNINDWIPGTPFPQARMQPPIDLDQLPLEQVTLAERLRARGYATWNVGKWHLGGDGFLPQDQGFDVNWMGSHIGHPASHHFPFGHATAGKPAHTHAVPSLPPDVTPGDYLADVQARTAAHQIHNAGRHGRPFYLQLSFYTVHTPIEAKAADVERHRALAQARGAKDGERPRPAFAAMLENLDTAVGTVLDALDAHGVAQDTIVVLTSDNGGLDSVSDNRPLRGGKRSLWEGGLRVPLLLRWPGVVAPGSRSDVPLLTQDVHRGLCAAAGAPVDAEVEADAFDPTPVWRGEAVGDRPPLFWHFPQHETNEVGPRGAMRDGRWKLIEDFASDSVQLFDLVADPNETTDVAAREPEQAAAMRARLRAWRQSVGAAMPTFRDASKQ